MSVITHHVVYPESDGQPMGENTLQVEWIFKIFFGLQAMFRHAEVFVAADLFWYPVENRPDIKTAPDILVALGRPRGHRASYLQWQEGGQPPQVVFEILSPGNRPAEMSQKFLFYQLHGVEEYYLLDPQSQELWGWQRANNVLNEIPIMNGWVSPRLGIRFERGDDVWEIYSPEGRAFRDQETLAEELESTDDLRDELSAEKQRADHLAEEIRRLREQLQAGGLTPE